MTRIKVLAFALFAFVLSAGLIACGGGGGGGSNGENPQQVVNATFSGKKDVKSGKLDVSLNVGAKGKTGGSVDARLSGPFESQGQGKLPKFDLTASLSGSGSGQNVSFDGGVASTGDKAFVSYKGSDYEVPATTFDQFNSRFQAQSKTSQSANNGALSKLGVHPQDWLTNLKNDGTQDVNGATTIHVSGDANISKLVDDLKKVAGQAGNLNVPSGTSLPNTQQLDQVKSAVKSAHFDLYTGEQDKILRKFDGTLKVDSNGSSADIAFSIGLADLNKPQTITAPANTKPLTDLLSQFGLGAGGLGALGGLGGASSGGGSAGAGAGGAGGAPSAGPSSAQSQKYLQCLQSAKSSAAVSACATQLGK